MYGMYGRSWWTYLVDRIVYGIKRCLNTYYVFTSQVGTQDEYITVTVDVIILSCSRQIYLHLLL